MVHVHICCACLLHQGKYTGPFTIAELSVQLRVDLTLNPRAEWGSKSNILFAYEKALWIVSGAFACKGQSEMSIGNFVSFCEFGMLASHWTGCVVEICSSRSIGYRSSHIFEIRCFLPVDSCDADNIAIKHHILLYASELVCVCSVG